MSDRTAQCSIFYRLKDENGGWIFLETRTLAITEQATVQAMTPDEEVTTIAELEKKHNRSIPKEAVEWNMSLMYQVDA